MGQSFWVFVGVALLIVVPFVVIMAKAFGAGRSSGKGDLGASPRKSTLASSSNGSSCSSFLADR